MKNTENKRKVGKIEIFIRIVVFLFLFNLLMNCGLILHYSLGRPYFPAKVFFASSTYLANFNIVPLEKTFGLNTPIVRPLYLLRDKLYDTGLKFLPADDAERVMWWYAAKYQPFYTIYTPLINKYADSEISDEQVNVKYILDFTDKIYEQLQLMASLKKLKDPYFKKYRFRAYTDDMAFSYINKRYLVYSMYNSHKNHQKLDELYNNPFLNDETEIKKIQIILDKYLELREYCKKNEIFGYNYVFQRGYEADDSSLIYLSTSFILGNQIINNKLDCNSKELKLHLHSRKLLLNDLQKNKISSNDVNYITGLLETERSLFVLENIKSICNKE